MQVLNIFGDGQNCQNQTFKWLYQLNESKYEKSFFGKILTVMLFHMYQVFSSLLGHLHFSLHFFSTFMEQLFLNHPISPLPNLDVLQALFGALPESEKSKLIHKVDSISKARWMKSITCGAEAELFKDQIPDTVFSEDDHAGVLS